MIWERFKAAIGKVDTQAIARINARLAQRQAGHPSFMLMNDVDKDLLPKGLSAGSIPVGTRTVSPEGGDPVSFGEFIRASWGGGEQCHLLITGEGGVGKTVALLTLATEQGFLPRNTAAIYVPLYELSQYCGEGMGAGSDCVDRFIQSDFADEGVLHDARMLAKKPWRDGPSLILLMDGYNEVPTELRSAVDRGVALVCFLGV